MLFTRCTACAAPLPEDPVRCAACAIGYCSERCERYDRRRGGHGKICGAIASGGGAEQYHANQKYDEAVAVGVEECAEDTKGQMCFICMDGDAEEGLVRGCACRGTAGFAHVSCLAEQAKILVAEAEANNLSIKTWNERWRRWDTCSLCEQRYHGVVKCALGWACWKTYLGRPEADWTRRGAMRQLGNGLSEAEHHEDALAVGEAELSMCQRLGGSKADILVVQANLATTYQRLGRLEEALSMRRDVYSERLELSGEEHEGTILAANNYAGILVKLNRSEEAKALSRKTIPVARRVLGENDGRTLKMRWTYARALILVDRATLGDAREAVTILEDTERIARRVLGGAHPVTTGLERDLRNARDALRETPFPLLISIAGLHGVEVYFKVNPTMPLQRIFDLYANRKGVAVESFQFLFNGTRVHGEQTSAAIGLEDGGQLDVVDASAAGTAV